MSLRILCCVFTCRVYRQLHECRPAYFLEYLGTGIWLVRHFLCGTQAFLEVIVGMIRWAVLDTPHHFIATFLVETRRLKTVRTKDHHRTPALLRLSFCCLEELATIPLVLHGGMNP